MEGRAPEVERAREQVHRGTRQPGLIRKVLGHRAAKEGRSRRSKEGRQRRVHEGGSCIPTETLLGMGGCRLAVLICTE